MGEIVFMPNLFIFDFMKQSTFFQIKWIATWCFFMLLGFSSPVYAYQVAIPVPYARLNAPKTHYLVAMPNTSSAKGYTAVFNAKTRKLKYKLNLFFTDTQVFLSDDGKRLIHVSEKDGEDEDLCFATVYDRNGEVGKMLVFTKESSDPEEGSYFPRLMDFEQENARLLIYTNDSIYRVDYQEMKMDLLPGNAEKKGSFVKFYAGFYTRDSLFDCSKLLVGKQDLKRQLCEDLKLHAIPDKKEARHTIYLSMTLNSNGTFDDLQVYAAKMDDTEKGNWNFDETLKERVLEVIKSYQNLQRNIPKGVGFWKYTGTIYLSD